MVGGTTSGYSLMGSRHMAMRPSRKTTEERTPAKIGRRMKKWENFMANGFPRRLVADEELGSVYAVRRAALIVGRSWGHGRRQLRSPPAAPPGRRGAPGRGR